MLGFILVLLYLIVIAKESTDEFGRWHWKSKILIDSERAVLVFSNYNLVFGGKWDKENKRLSLFIPCLRLILNFSTNKSKKLYYYKGNPYTIVTESKIKLKDFSSLPFITECDLSNAPDWTEVVIYQCEYNNPDGKIWVRFKTEFYNLFVNREE